MLGVLEHLLDAGAPELDDLMTCLGALLDVMDSSSLSSIFMNLAAFQDRKSAAQRQPTAGYDTVAPPL